MTQAIRPQKPSDEYGKGGTKFASGKLPEGGFRAVAAFGEAQGVKKSPTTQLAAKGVNKLWHPKIGRQGQEY
jgi:hypothetical protein